MMVERDITDPPLPEGASLGDWAIFLDLDGTLLDLAPRPDAVHVPHDLAGSLDALQLRSGGAVAILSGRPLQTIVLSQCLDRRTNPFGWMSPRGCGRAFRQAGRGLRRA